MNTDRLQIAATITMLIGDIQAARQAAIDAPELIGPALNDAEAKARELLELNQTGAGRDAAASRDQSIITIHTTESPAPPCPNCGMPVPVKPNDSRSTCQHCSWSFITP